MFNFTTINSIKENVSYGTLQWHELVAYAKKPHNSHAQTPEAAKKTAKLVAAHNGSTRHKQQAEASLFGLLRADLDDALNQTPETIAAALREQGLDAFIIYSTLNHQPELPRYRVFVALAEPVTFAVWQDLQFELAELLDSDPCVNRSAQFMILPTTIATTANHYTYLIAEGTALCSTGVFWMNALNKAKKYAIAAMSTTPPAPEKAIESLLGRQVSIINLVNNSYSWAELLLFYGYKQKGKATWIAPESVSGVAGVHLLMSSTDGKERIYSHHESDPAGGRLCDKFDLMVIRSFNGNHRIALEEIARKAFPDAYKHNRREWRIAQMGKGGAK